MLLWIHDRLRKDDKGFTLIELMVVVLIIAILIAIAIPTFLGARKRAQDRQAQSNLRNGLTTEKTYYADAQVFTTVTTELTPIESNLSYTTTDAAARGVMVTTACTGQCVVLVSTSKSGNHFCIMEIAQDQTTALNGQTGAGTYYLKKATAVTTPETSVGTDDCGTSGYQNTTAGWT
jgi:type IV pilus assembly protein PilA